MVAHDNVGPKFHSLAREDIPLTHIELVCFPDTCGGKDGRTISDYEPPRFRNSGIAFCNHCKRPPHWYLYRCVNCNRVFLKDFLDPKFCFAYPYCWNCLPQLSWAFCPDHISTLVEDKGIVYNRGTRFERTVHFHEPLGLNPKVYSDEELDAFWNELIGE